MAEEPISVRITVGDRVGTVELVGDPADGLLAVQIGRAVTEFLLEQIESPTA